MFLCENQNVVCYVGFLAVKKSQGKACYHCRSPTGGVRAGGGGMSGDGARGVCGAQWYCTPRPVGLGGGQQ